MNKHFLSDFRPPLSLSEVSALAAAPSSEWILFANKDSQIVGWNPRTVEFVCRNIDHLNDSPICGVAWSDFPKVFVVFNDKLVLLDLFSKEAEPLVTEPSDDELSDYEYRQICEEESKKSCEEDIQKIEANRSYSREQKDQLLYGNEK